MHVYFVRAGNKGAIKIGVAKNIAKRMETMQTGNPFELKLLASIPCTCVMQAFEIERRLHNLFRAKRIRGEWFCGDINFRAISDIKEVYEAPPTADQILEYKAIAKRTMQNNPKELSKRQSKQLIRERNERRRLSKLNNF